MYGRSYRVRDPFIKPGLFSYFNKNLFFILFYIVQLLSFKFTLEKLMLFVMLEVPRMFDFHF